MGLPWVTNLAVWWDDPANAQFYRDLASFTRVVLFDKRGVGLSDRDVGIPTLEEAMDDFRAVMDAVGSKKAVVLGFSESGAMSLLFAAAHPERTLGLIVIGGYSKTLRAPDYPWGVTEEFEQDLIRRYEHDWGTQAFTDFMVPEIAPSRANDPEFKRWFGRMTAIGGSPSSAIALEKMMMQIDVRAALATIHAPTLVLAGDAGPDLGMGKQIASNVTGAKFIQLPGHDHAFFANPYTTSAVLQAIRDFVRELPEVAESERVLTTVLFADIVGSTRRASELGDLHWGQVLEQYLTKARTDLSRYRGRLIKTTGDGLLAIFDGPTRAVRCACSMRDDARSSGLEIRAGLHTGECIMKESDIQGIAVHIASRICGLAGGGEVLVSGTVKDLSVGSGVPFEDRGIESLRGVEGNWQIYSVMNL
jgi:class 3 adenylate cyclase